MSGPGNAGSVAVVVLTWNGCKDTMRCLTSLVEHAGGCQVVVVDNGSTDGTAAAVRAAFPGVVLLENETNLGFSGGNNSGLRWALSAGFEVVGILNNDTVVEAGFLPPLLAAIASEPGAVYASPIIRYLDHPEDVWFEGARATADTEIFVHDRPGADLGSSRTRSPMISGCALFAHRSVWSTVGPLDDDYFLIFEDADWSARANAAGCHGVVVRDSRILHAVSSTIRARSASAADYYYARNGIRFIRSHARRPRRASLRFVLDLARGGMRPLRADRRARNLAMPVLQCRGVVDALRRRGGPLRLGPVTRWAMGAKPTGAGVGL